MQIDKHDSAGKLYKKIIPKITDKDSIYSIINALGNKKGAFGKLDFSLDNLNDFKEAVLNAKDNGEITLTPFQEWEMGQNIGIGANLRWKWQKSYLRK